MSKGIMLGDFVRFQPSRKFCHSLGYFVQGNYFQGITYMRDFAKPNLPWKF